MKFQRVLFPTDFSPSADSALAHALFQAELADTALYMLHAVITAEDDRGLFFTKPETLTAKMEEVAQARFQEALPPALSEPLNIVQRTIRGQNAASIILNFAKENDCGLIVMGTHGRRGLKHFFLGSVAEEVARLAACPVLTVRGDGHTKAPTYRNILVPVALDGTEKGQLEAVRKMSKLHQSRVTLLHVVDLRAVPTGLDAEVAPMGDLIEKITAFREAQLKESAREVFGTTDGIGFLMETGSPSRNIVHHADALECDLIMMNTAGAEWEKILLGSTAERVIRTASCPVLTMHPKTNP